MYYRQVNAPVNPVCIQGGFLYTWAIKSCLLIKFIKTQSKNLLYDLCQTILFIWNTMFKWLRKNFWSRIHRGR